MTNLTSSVRRSCLLDFICNIFTKWHLFADSFCSKNFAIIALLGAAGLRFDSLLISKFSEIYSLYSVAAGKIYEIWQRIYYAQIILDFPEARILTLNKRNSLLQTYTADMHKQTIFVRIQYKTDKIYRARRVKTFHLRYNIANLMLLLYRRLRTSVKKNDVIINFRYYRRYC